MRIHMEAGCCFTTTGASTLQKPLENITLVIKRILLLRFVEQDTSLMCSCNARFGQNTGGNDGKPLNAARSKALISFTPSLQTDLLCVLFHTVLSLSQNSRCSSAGFFSEHANFFGFWNILREVLQLANAKNCVV